MADLLSLGLGHVSKAFLQVAQFSESVSSEKSP